MQLPDPLKELNRYSPHDFNAHTDSTFQNWLQNRNAIGFLGVWEQLNNPGFKPIEFDGIRIQTILNRFAATTCSIEADDFDYAPFSQRGGLSKAHQLFGEQLPNLLEELNATLAV